MADNALLKLLKDVRDWNYWPTAKAKLNEAIGMVSMGRMLSDPRAEVQCDTVRIKTPCLVIPIPKPEPVVTDRHRKLARTALSALIDRYDDLVEKGEAKPRNYLPPGWSVAPADEEIEAAARAIARAEAGL